MKKYLLLSLLLISVLTLSACGTSKEESPLINEDEETNLLSGENGSATGLFENENVDKNKLKQELSGIPGSGETTTKVSTTTAMENESPKTNLTNTMMNVDKSKFENLTTQYTQAVFNTNQGSFTIKFYNEKAPLTVNNFLNLANLGFYNNVKFHRIISNFMIQGGDQFTKDDSMSSRWGTGGPGYAIADEFGEGLTNAIGTISMANSGPNSGGSQFFINVANNSFLDGKHAVFGEVVEGMAIVNKLAQSSVDSSDRPVSPVVIQSITLK